MEGTVEVVVVPLVGNVDVVVVLAGVVDVVVDAPGKVTDVEVELVVEVVAVVTVVVGAGLEVVVDGGGTDPAAASIPDVCWPPITVTMSAVC